MRRLKLWIGLTMAALTVALAIPIIAVAAVGDVLFVAPPTEPAQLTAGQKSKLAAPVNNTFPEASVADLDAMTCTRDNEDLELRCKASDTGGDPMTPAELRDAVFAGTVTRDMVEPCAPNWCFKTRRFEEVAVPSPYLGMHDTFTTDACGTALAGVHAYRVWRDDETPSIIWFQCWLYDTKSPADWATDWYNGDTRREVAIVEE